MINLELNAAQRNIITEALEMYLFEINNAADHATSTYFRDKFNAESFAITNLRNLVQDTPDGVVSDEALKIRVLGFLRQGQKIDAIKYVRQHRQLGLKEAKDYVDNFQTTN